MLQPNQRQQWQLGAKTVTLLWLLCCVMSMSACETLQGNVIPDSLLQCEWPPTYQDGEATQADAGAALTQTFLAGDSCADNLRRVRELLKPAQGLKP